MARRQKNRKIVSVKRKRPMNIDLVFFGAIAVYIIIICYMALSQEHISGYEVNVGSLAVNHRYTGFALRDESVFSAETSGYVSYYAREGERVSGSSLIYTVDEKGEINELIQKNAESVDLTDSNFSVLRGEIQSFTHNYDDFDFTQAYQFQSSISSSVLELMNQSMLDSLDEAGESSMFSRVYAGGIGIIEYYTDGYEDTVLESMTEAMLDPATYEPVNLKKEIIQAGENVYKLSKSEKWSLIIPLSNEEVRDFVADNTRYMEVEFVRDHTTAWANFSIVNVGTQQCARLDFNNSMVRFADLRYVDVEFLVDDQQGLKIPNSSIVEKSFYTIPKEYLVEQEDGQGFWKETYNENGESSVKFITMTLYYEDDDSYYVDPKETDYMSSVHKLDAGNFLIKPDSQERFQVAAMSTLKGVYNINKGYTQFRQISIIAQNEEYTLVKEGTSFGLTVYDHIVLNGNSVDEEEILY